MAWLPEHAVLEANGQWQSLLDIVTGIEMHELPLRWQACVARAHSFFQRSAQATALLDRLDILYPSECQADYLATKFLARAFVAKQRSDWKGCRSFVEKVLHLPIVDEAQQYLLLDAEFYMGFCLESEGRLYMALDQYSGIRKNPQASPWRSSLAAMNEAWYLWNLGQVSLIKEILGQVPEAYRLRLQVAVAVYELDNAFLLSVLADRSIPLRFSEEELLKASTFLSEWLLVADDETRARFAGSWFDQFLSRAVDFDRGAEEKAVLQACRQALYGQANFDPTAFADWHNYTDYLFIVWLAQNKGRGPTGLAAYKNNLDPILTEKRVSVPLTPHSYFLEKPETAWQRHLRQFLGLQSHAAHKDNELIYKEQKIRLAKNPKCFIDFSKSPQSHILMSLLLQDEAAGKEAIHRALTGNRYVPELHDDRIYKLIRRVNSRCKEIFGQNLIEMRRDNRAYLIQRVELQG